MAFLFFFVKKDSIAFKFSYHYLHRAAFFNKSGVAVSVTRSGASKGAKIIGSHWLVTNLRCELGRKIRGEY